MMRAGADARHARVGIVLAHGRGGSAADVLRLIEMAGLTDVAAIAPQARGNVWWPTSFLATSAQIAPYLAAALAAIRTAVLALEADGMPRHRIWLGGFSQGACLALESFAREGTDLAGVFGFSGGLLGTSDAGGEPQAELYGHLPKAFDYQGRRDDAKVWISVHERDPHIPLKRVEDSAQVLGAQGADVRLQVYPGAGHAVMAEDIAAMRGGIMAR
ncbi:MAG: dienelactone hydrolase family protein [Rhodobacteraceae bacterium]|jgi:phospholipase/carboxylesterase|nr:dienelactone hydrolase family protein [Paracoccaceae bacterium]